MHGLATNPADADYSVKRKAANATHAIFVTKLTDDVWIANMRSLIDQDSH